MMTGPCGGRHVEMLVSLMNGWWNRLQSHKMLVRDVCTKQIHFSLKKENSLKETDMLTQLLDIVHCLLFKTEYPEGGTYGLSKHGNGTEIVLCSEEKIMITVVFINYTDLG
jgi:hypothetical protein